MYMWCKTVKELANFSCPYFHVPNCYQEILNAVSYFRVAVCLCVKMSISANFWYENVFGSAQVVNRTHFKIQRFHMKIDLKQR